MVEIEVVSSPMLLSDVNFDWLVVFCCRSNGLQIQFSFTTMGVG